MLASPNSLSDNVVSGARDFGLARARGRRAVQVIFRRYCFALIRRQASRRQPHSNCSRTCDAMAITRVDPFPGDALETNRSGQLTTAQRDRLRPIARYARQSALVAAVIFVVAAAMMLSDQQLSLPAVLRVPFAAGCLVLAAFFLVRAIVGGDALTRDLRHAKVQSTEGAIGKRSRSSTGGRSSTRTYWLDVGDGTFRVSSRAGYDAAPDAGMVRVYFLPRSRRVVNLERLPDAALAPGMTPHDVLASLGAAVRSRSRRELNEVRAMMAPVVDAANAAREEHVTPPARDARDPRPLELAIVGTWTSALMTVAFQSDGNVSATMLGGMQRRGRWSVDRGGRLISDVTGHRGAADAWVSGNQLTISADGTALTFTRESSS